MIWLSFEDMMADKPAAIGRIAESFGLDKTQAEIAAAIVKSEGDQAKSRFNKGVSGRGEEQMSAGQKARIRRLADYNPSIDFTPIGL